MTGVRDDIVRWLTEAWTNVTTPENASNTQLFFDLLYPIALIGFILAIAFTLFRTYRYVTSYAGDGEPLGPFKITIQGLTTVHGNLSRHYFITDAEYDLLKTLDYKDIGESIQDFRDRVEKGLVFVYDFRITDYDEAFDLKGGKDSIVLSPINLESSEVSWLDTKGERSITSPTFRVKHRNVVCFSLSKYHQDVVINNRDLDIYDLVPIPKTLTNMKLDSVNQVVLHLTKLANAKGDASLSEYLKTIAENWQEIQPLRDEIKRLRQIMLSKDIELSDIYKSGEHDRHMGFTNPVIGFKKKDKEMTRGNLIGMFMAIFFIGGMCALLPQMLPGLNVSGMLTLLGGAGVFFFVLYMMLEKHNDTKQKESSILQP